jgi:hypothetical protein
VTFLNSEGGSDDYWETMTALFDLSLQEGDLVHLDIGNTNEGVECMLTGFFGPDFVLMPTQGVSRRTRVTLPSQPVAYVWIKYRGRYLAQRGVVFPDVNDDQLIFRVTDTFRIGQRRAYSRAPLAFPIEIEPLGVEAEPWQAVTADVSAGGLRLAPVDLAVFGPENGLTIAVGDERVRAKAVVVREDPRAIGMRYTLMADQDRLRFAQLALAWHRDQLAGVAAGAEPGEPDLLEL